MVRSAPGRVHACSVPRRDGLVRWGFMVWFRARQRRIESVLATAGLLAAVALGAWWTAQAVVDGRPWAMVARFTVSVVGGIYYLLLLAISRRPA